MKVDVVILSAIKTRDLTIQSIQSIQTLKASEVDIEFNIVVIEESDFEYEEVTNLKIEEEFNYNRFMNLGAATSDADYIVFCNNDLIFHEGWFTEMLKYDYDCMAPRSMRDFRQWGYTEDVVTGFSVGSIFSGWCFVLKRTIWEQIGGLDEDFKFWYADNATIEQLRAIGVVPNLITKSYVEHVGSQTLIQEPIQVQMELTERQSAIFFRKYGRN